MADSEHPKGGKAQQFTELESKLIGELRTQLPDILLEASNASSKPISHTLWGVDLQPSPSADRDLRIDVILGKFLKARTNDVHLARTMLVNTLQWRAEYGTDSILDEQFPDDVFGHVGMLYGRDKDGRPVTYNFYGGVDNKQVFGDLDRFLRWRVQLHERGMQQLDFVDVADMVQVHDYEGVGLLSYDKLARMASKATVQIMSDNYPETLATKIFANVPGWGETVFNIIGRWLSEDTKKKFVVVSKTSARAVLAQRIGGDVPEKFRAHEPVGDMDASKTEDVEGDGERAGATATLSAPEPRPAHMDVAEDLPKPTDAVDVETQGNEAQPVPEPAVTAAPEDIDPVDNPSDLATETAGMRLDDSTDPKEETPATQK
ncbi:Non-classical phosphatidylinositol transfer protein (PITP) [Coemansia sp. RSA 1822]|nr:Non-classical phosphatidylinositol transfer protein (PITP) [Coemansia sp. RSA 638]KAJ2544113.1 Non-classical phosphatidylinositol transfer protein (PITP) [Coemansia sp. RSA 1853]KAJ2567434.1 Non-classical phosphatidylinositol transfer protein (PITP) [Coemansia sp. RSA 1822]